MSTALAIDHLDFEHRDDEALTASEWSRLLGVGTRAFNLRKITKGGMAQGSNNGLVTVFRFRDLPEDYRITATALRESQGVALCRDLLDIDARNRATWQPPRKLAQLPPATQEKAQKVREVMLAYFAALDQGKQKNEANAIARSLWVRLFPEPPASSKKKRKPCCTSKTISNWEKKIKDRGGPDFAPIEAYADGKSVPHVSTRLESRIPADLIAEYKDLSTKVEHLAAAHRALEIEWLMGREVPGIGCRKGDAPFPYTERQLRKFAASTAARRMGSHGKARARRECLPNVATTTANLRRGELYQLDDTRVDIIATDDLTGRPVELKSYIMMDVGPRRIEGWLLREAGNIRASDVEALVARVLRSSGVAALRSGYLTTIKHERGTVACSPARQSLIEGAFPGRVRISRTSMDGGKNHGGDFSQASSGHWQGKQHIESFMRTFAFFLEHAPGQRGGDYTRQPAALGLKGRDHATNALDYTRGSRIADAALLTGAERAIEYIEDGLEARIEACESDRCERVNGRLKINSLLPASRIAGIIREVIAYYNARTDHRMEGFARIESQGTDGRTKWRMESPDERANRLANLCPTERLSVQDASMLVRTVTRTVTVKPNGVTMDLSPYKGLRFFRPDSIACHEAGLLSTCEKKFVAAFDPESILHSGVQEIYLLAGTGPDWKPGDPAKFVEALPLAQPLDRARPEDAAAELEKTRGVEHRMAAELLRAAAPSIARRLADSRENVSRLREINTTSLPDFGGGIVEGDFRPESAPTRADQRLESEDAYLKTLSLDTPVSEC